MELAKSQKELTQIKGAYTYIGTGYMLSDEFVKNIIPNIEFISRLEDCSLDDESDWSGTGYEELTFGVDGLDEFYTFDVFVNFSVKGYSEISRGNGYLTPTECFNICNYVAISGVNIYLGGDDVILTDEQAELLKTKIQQELNKNFL